VTKRTDKSVTRLSFDAATESCIRLAAFGANLEHLVGMPEFCAGVADELAHKDIVTLAISGRRLAEAANLYNLSKAHEVKHQAPVQLSPLKWEFRASDQTVNLWDLFSRIIHSTEFEVVSHDFWIKLNLGVLESDINERYKAMKFKNQFKPVFRLTTDRIPLVIFEILEVSTKSLSFLEDAAEELADHDIYLGQHSD
jgi:hypothetical protein